MPLHEVFTRLGECFGVSIRKSVCAEERKREREGKRKRRKGRR